MEERRMFARINIKIPLKFMDSHTEAIGEAEVVDVSANGVGFVTKENLAVDTPLDVWLYVPDNHDPIHIVGKVVWSQQLDDNIHKRVGVHLGEERLIGLGRIWVYKETHPDKI